MVVVYRARWRPIGDHRLSIRSHGIAHHHHVLGSLTALAVGTSPRQRNGKQKKVCSRSATNSQLVVFLSRQTAHRSQWHGWISSFQIPDVLVAVVIEAAEGRPPAQGSVVWISALFVIVALRSSCTSQSASGRCEFSQFLARRREVKLVCLVKRATQFCWLLCVVSRGGHCWPFRPAPKWRFPPATRVDVLCGISCVIWTLLRTPVSARTLNATHLRTNSTKTSTTTLWKRLLEMNKDEATKMTFRFDFRSFVDVVNAAAADAGCASSGCGENGCDVRQARTSSSRRSSKGKSQAESKSTAAAAVFIFVASAISLYTPEPFSTATATILAISASQSLLQAVVLHRWVWLAGGAVLLVLVTPEAAAEGY